MRLSAALRSAFRAPKYGKYDPTKTGISHYVNYTSEKGRWNMFWVILSFWASVYYVGKLVLLSSLKII